MWKILFSQSMKSTNTIYRLLKKFTKKFNLLWQHRATKCLYKNQPKQNGKIPYYAQWDNGFWNYNGDKFEVLEDSQIDFSKPANHEKYNDLRHDLIKSGDILNINGKYILKTTLEFNTPSGAGQFILGGAINGWVEWENDDGKTLDEIYRKNA